MSLPRWTYSLLLGSWRESRPKAVLDPKSLRKQSILTNLLFVCLSATIFYVKAPDLVRCTERAMRVICAQGIGEEPETDNFAHNEKSLAYVGGPSKSYFKVW